MALRLKRRRRGVSLPKRKGTPRFKKARIAVCVTNQIGRSLHAIVTSEQFLGGGGNYAITLQV